MPAEYGKPDLGITNPGGLRADLIFKGDTTSNPLNTDGVITFAEANSVLPFVNNLSPSTLTGAQLKKVLEQQWQPAGASRPFLHLGLSDNVQTTLDPSLPVGQRVTSVMINGAAARSRQDLHGRDVLVPAPPVVTTSPPSRRARPRTPARSTATCGSSTSRTAKPVAPNFVREQIYASGLKASYRAGEKARVVFTKLDMNALGAPKNTKLDLVKVNRDGSTKTFGDGRGHQRHRHRRPSRSAVARASRSWRRTRRPRSREPSSRPSRR